MIDTLLVYCNHILIGTLERHASRLAFRYAAGYLTQTGIPLLL